MPHPVFRLSGCQFSRARVALLGFCSFSLVYALRLQFPGPKPPFISLAATHVLVRRYLLTNCLFRRVSSKLSIADRCSHPNLQRFSSCAVMKVGPAVARVSVFVGPLSEFHHGDCEESRTVSRASDKRGRFSFALFDSVVSSGLPQRFTAHRRIFRPAKGSART